MSTYSLDDVVTLLLQIEPGDRQSLDELGERLRVLASDATLTPAVRAFVASAAAQVTLVADENALAALRRLLGEAVAERDLGEAAPAAPSFLAPDEDPPVEIVLPEDADVSLLTDFVAESNEYLENSEAALLKLESDPDDAEAVNTIFRAFHTIKGTSAFLGLELVTEFAHHAETLLSRVRDREIRCTGGYAGLALRSRDILQGLMRGVEAALQGETPEPVPDYHMLLRRLQNPESYGISEVEKRQAWVVQRAVTEDPTLVTEPEDVVPAPTVVPIASSAAEPSAPSQVHASAATPQPAQRQGAAERRVDSSVRVRTDRLDRLVDMVGELVIAQTMITQDAIVKSGGHYELARKVAHAEKIVRELQDLSMGMRMVPLKSQFQKVARLVRDLAHRNGKLVHFAGEGEETEIDRNMVDYLGDPLVHMVRNAVDHGIESPDEREAGGKPRIGVLRVSAYHAGGNVVVELRDDGRGLNRERILRKAIAQGLITSAEGLSDSDVFNMIFAPGFSTAEKVTDVSGRGVGMDVVKRNIEAMRGRIDIASEPGQGTTFTIRLPLTLAITDGMLVRVGDERFIVPTIAIQLSFRPERSMLSTLAGRGEMVMLRGEVLPLIRLHRVLDVPGAVEEPSQALVMIVGDGNERGAILVDELLGQHQVVAKSLGDGVGRVRGLSGGAILGDGRVGLIIDVPELIALSRQPRDGEHRPVSAAASAVA